MKRTFFLSISVASLMLIAAGCTTKSAARAEASKAFNEGQKMEMPKPDPNAIIVLGQVRNHSIQWKEGINLAQVLEEAHYTGFSDPRTLRVTRGDESINIPVNDLLKGKTNPEIEKGDIITIMR